MTIRISKYELVQLINSHLLATAESAQKKTELKKQKEKNRVNNYGWNIFSEVTHFLTHHAGSYLSWI